MPRRTRSARTALSVLAVAGLLLGAACSSDSDSDEATKKPTGTTGPGTTEGTMASTTAKPVETSLDYSFTATATTQQATKAAETMTLRLENAGHAGSTAEVNDAGTGLVITVLGVATEQEALAIVKPLTAIGTVWFRPVTEGPLAPAANEKASQATPEIVGTGTTIAVDEQPTTPPNQDNPDGTALLAQPDTRDDSVVARYLVGPAQVSGDTVVDASTTTQDGNPAVKVVLQDSPEGLQAFNKLAQTCYDKAGDCESGAYAVTFDGLVATASTVRPNKPFTPFTQSDLIIHSETWTTEYAELLAAVIEAGALPVGIAPA